MEKLSFTPLLLFLCCFFFNGLWGQTPMVKTVWFWPPKENAKVFLKIKNDDTGEFYQAPQSLPPISIKDATKSWDNNQIVAPVSYVSAHSYETCYYLSCQSAHGKGLSQGDPDIDDVTLRIYDEFQDRDVKKFNGTKSMTYWGPTTGSTACNSIGQLLINENTTCGIWSDFLVEMHTLHGIKSNPKTVFYGDSQYTNSSVGGIQGVLSLANSEACSLAVQNYFGSLDNIEFFTIPFTKNCFAGFHVKNWNFTSQGNFFLSRQTAPIQVNNHTISYVGLGSIPCQGYNSGPVPNHVPTSFANHAIVEYKSKDGTLWYFDPSYGSPVSDNPQNFGTWENSSLDGYGVSFIYYENSSGQPIEVVWLREIESASTTQTRLKN